MKINILLFAAVPICVASIATAKQFLIYLNKNEGLMNTRT